ncbi:Galactinol synthase 1 [Acorus calamus]|uniref:Hexosyltransferase n=1 Tax=Acorus calamus TaxID=4465 RepID=A0AAV9F158_ACOCL|nr:Galactinol synthase 1 [Acorus calamus]
MVTRKTRSGGLAKAAGPTRRAFVTFLAGDGDYVKGVVGLAKGLRKVKSAYPLVVAVLPDVPEEHLRLLRSQGCIVRQIEPVYPLENQTRFAMAYYVINYSKLRIWNFAEYDKMVYLDADIQVYENVDELFDLPDGGFYAVMDCFCEKTWSHTPQPFHVRVAALHSPSHASHSLRRTGPGTDPSFLFLFLFLFFWALKDIYKPIPLVYNLVLAMLWRHPENVVLDKVKVVHYCAAGSKPWRYTGKEENMEREDIKMLVKKWWDVYNDESLDYKGPVVGADEEAERLKQPLLAALSEAGTVHFITAPSAA